MAPITSRAECAIEIRSVSKRYGSKLAIDDISLSLDRGKVLGLVGPNGAGKTTTLSLLAGFSRASAGSIRVLGHGPGVRQGVGVFAQRAALPKKETVRHFLLYLARLQRIERPEAALRLVLQRLGAEQTLETPCGDLSYGMAKRVCLAQALLGDPELLLLDEPTAGVDAHGVFEMTKVLREFQGAVVLASHNLQQIEGLCDEVVVLDQGRVIEQVSMEQLRALSHIHVRLTHWQIASEAVADLQQHFEVQLLAETCELRIRPKSGKQQTVSDVLRVLVRYDVPIASINETGQLQQRLDARSFGIPADNVVSTECDNTVGDRKAL